MIPMGGGGMIRGGGNCKEGWCGVAGTMGGRVGGGWRGRHDVGGGLWRSAGAKGGAIDSDGRRGGMIDESTRGGGGRVDGMRGPRRGGGAMTNVVTVMIGDDDPEGITKRWCQAI